MKLRFLLALPGALVFGSPIAEARSIKDIPAAKEALLRIVSPKFYRSLAISPVEGWVVVRGDLVNDHLARTRVVRSDADRDYNKLALDLADNLQIVDRTRADTLNVARSVSVHLLIYKIADGTMAMSFAHFDEAGGNQLRYSGAAWMAVRRGDNWVTIDPRQLSPHERRGPRTYTLAVEPANSSRTLQGNGRPPANMTAIEGAGVNAGHSIKNR
jgi:hypothetical protein